MGKTTTQMQLVEISKLIPYINNARTHSKEQITKLRSSLREFGFINPVIIDNEYNVIAGHGRIEAAKQENITEVPCVFVEYLTPAQKRAYIIADNRMAMDAGWDEELLKIEIEALQSEAFDIDLTGFEEQEIADLFDTEEEVQEDDFDISGELSKPIITKKGDLWLLGNHRLICGDSTKEETYPILMNGKKANLVVTDPPYNVNYEANAGKIKNDNMDSNQFYQFLLSAFLNMKEAMENDASIYVFHADTEGLNFRKAMMSSGFKLAECLVWVKNAFVMGRQDYHWKHEPVLYGWKPGASHYFINDRSQSTVLEFDKPIRNEEHPTMKPIDLIAYLKAELINEE